MKKTLLTPARLLVVAVVAGLSLALISWDYRQDSRYEQNNERQDTIPSKKKKDGKVRDLDEAIAELDRVDLDLEMEKALKQAAEALKQVDMARIQAEIEKSLKDIDLDKIRLETEASLSKVDMKKIEAEIKEAMKEAEVDMKKAREEMEKAFKEIDMEKIQREMKESLEKVNWDEMRKELEEAKKLDLKEAEAELKKAQEELEKMGPELKKSLAEAQRELEKARADLALYKELVDGLHNDGLINKEGNYTIEHKNGELKVDGKKVSDAVYNKYRQLLNKKKQFRLEKSEDGLNIDRDDD